MHMAFGRLTLPTDNNGCGTSLGDDCEGCGGRGIRAPATPSCVLPPLQDGWCVVERCDYCEVYEDDLAAAMAISDVARWVVCASGGWHAIARL
jgi:hypothetical protein